MVFTCTLVQSSNHFVVVRNHFIVLSQVVVSGKPHARMLKSTCIYREIVYGEISSERKLHLEGGGEIPILTVSNSAFLRHP